MPQDEESNFCCKRSLVDPLSHGAHNMPKNIIIFSDGTGQAGGTGTVMVVPPALFSVAICTARQHNLRNRWDGSSGG
jgi:hypothetical protein